MSKTVEEHFQIRQDRRRLQLKRLEEELGRLRESIETREKSRSEIVERRLGELTGDAKQPEF